MESTYECMLILKPDISDSEKEETAGEITKKIKEVGGQVIKSLLWSKVRDFHYFLKSKGAERKKYYQGAYWLIDFILPKEKLAELKETIRLEERILRSLILSKKKSKVKVSQAET